MSDYISREKVLEFVEPDARPFLAERIRNIPAADVRPVVRGKWVEFETDTPPRRNVCSECGYTTNPWLAHVYNFCPNCGASMEEEQT